MKEIMCRCLECYTQNTFNTKKKEITPDYALNLVKNNTCSFCKNPLNYKINTISELIRRILSFEAFGVPDLTREITVKLNEYSI